MTYLRFEHRLSGLAGEVLDSGLLPNILRPGELAEGARCRRRFGVSEPFCIDRRLTGSALK
jgi:hypothetical protein